MRRKVKDDSGQGLNRLPDVPQRDLILFHWSPSTNRSRINRYGLTPGRKTLQGLWRPPYVCFSDDPYLAWILSGRMWPEIPEWDLWMYNMDGRSYELNGYEIILDTYKNSERRYIKEYRIYQRIYKRDLVLLATRSQ